MKTPAQVYASLPARAECPAPADVTTAIQTLMASLDTMLHVSALLRPDDTEFPNTADKMRDSLTRFFTGYAGLHARLPERPQ